MRSPRIIFIVLAIIALALTVFSVNDYRIYLNDRETSSLDVGKQVVNNISSEIEKVLVQIENRTKTLADSLSNNDIRDQALIQLIESECKSMDQVLGVAVAFEPYKYRDTSRLFSPYYDKKAGKTLYLGQMYDYTDSNVTKWYTDVIQKGASWISPYYGQGAQAMICDYGAPFYRKDSTGKSYLAGTVTLTISLQDFTDMLNALSLGKTGYGFIVSSNGDYIAHPINEYVSNKNIITLAEEHGDEVFARVGIEMIAQKSGFEQYNNKISDQESFLFYNKIDYANWSLGVVFIKNELLGNAVALRKKLMHIGFSLSLLVLVLFGLYSKIYLLGERSIWKMSVLFSAVLLANISFIWYITITYSETIESEERYKIVNTAALNRFVSIENEVAKALRLNAPIEIPTGVFINEIEFDDSYNVNMSVTVWQKYHHERTKGIQRDIYFPQTSPFAEAITINRQIEDKGTYDLVTYDVRGTYRLNFDYSRYPFDSRQIDLKLKHPNRDKNVMLTPHLEGYKILSQSSNPGINPKAVLPESEVKASYFDYSMESYNSNFGQESFIREEFPELHFNVLLKRKFINAFVSNIIPILIVAMMLYFLVYGTSKKEGTNSSKGSLGIVESSAAFFFVLLLAHIDHRKIVNTPVITYMESFYFIMYIILALVAFNIVMFVKKDNFLFFDYKDNLIVKISFWPMFMLLCFVVTLVRFY